MKCLIMICFLWSVSLEGRMLPTLEAAQQQVCSVCLKPASGSTLRLIFMQGAFQFICIDCLQKKGGGAGDQSSSEQIKLPWKQTLAQTSFEECAAAFEYRQLWKKEVEESMLRQFTVGAYSFVVPGGVAPVILMKHSAGKEYRLRLPKTNGFTFQISTIEPLDDLHALFITKDGAFYKFNMDTKKATKVEGKSFNQVVKQLAKNQSGGELEKSGTHKVLSDYV